MVTQGVRSGTKRNKMGRDRHARRLTLTHSLPLLYGYIGGPGRDGTTQAAAATGSTRAATATREATGTHTIIFCHCFSTFIFP